MKGDKKPKLGFHDACKCGKIKARNRKECITCFRKQRQEKMNKKDADIVKVAKIHKENYKDRLKKI